MPIARCQHCKERYVYDQHDRDYLHTCNSDSSALNNEDRWNIAAADYQWQGLPNRFGGTDLNTPDARKVYRYTARGHRAATTYVRQFYKHQDVAPRGDGL